MPIQTSSITTSTDGDLTLDPNGTGKVVMTDLAAGSTKQVAVDANGNVQNLDTAALPLATDVDDGDLVVIQAGATHNGLTAGQIYKADASNLGGRNVIDPLPADVTAIPDFEGGSGTASDPYIIRPAISSTPGQSVQSTQYITVRSSKGGVVHMSDISDAPAFGRFTQPNGAISPNGGTYSFYLDYNDAPSTPIGEGQVYRGLIQLGGTTVYFSWSVAQVSNATQFQPLSDPTASPTTVSYASDGKYGTVSANWADGSMTLSNPDSNLVFSVNSGTMDGASKDVADGDLVKVGFNAAVVAAAAEGTTISGVLGSKDDTYVDTFTLTKDITPAPFTIPPQSNAQISAQVTSTAIALTAINAPATITSLVGGTNALTSLSVSVAGAAFTSTFPVTYNPGDTLQIRGTTGSGAGTAYSAVITVGGVTSTFVATNGATAASLVTPTILSPGDFDGVEQAEDVAVTSSAIARVDGGAVTQASSTWEAYKATGSKPKYLSTDTITAVAETGTTSVLTLASNTNLANFTPGHTVEQSGPYVPVSSTITNVNDLSTIAVTSFLAWNGWAGGNWGTTQTWSALSQINTVGVDQQTTPGYSSTTESVSTPFKFRIGEFGSGSSGSGGWAIMFSQAVTIKINPVDLYSDKIASVVACASLSDPISAGTTYSTFPAVATGRVFWYQGNDPTDGRGLDMSVMGDILSPGVDLTLTNTTDLAFFQSGDLVQGQQEAPNPPTTYKLNIANPTGSGKFLELPSALPDLTGSPTGYTNGWVDETYGAEPIAPTDIGNNAVQYYEFPYAFRPTFGYADKDNPSGTSTPGLWSFWCRWDGSNWIVDDKSDKALGNGFALIGRKPAVYWLALRLADNVQSSYPIGSSLGTVGAGPAGPTIGELGGGFGSQYFITGANYTSTGVTVTSTDSSTPSMMVSGGAWSGTDGSSSPVTLTSRNGSNYNTGTNTATFGQDYHKNQSSTKDNPLIIDNSNWPLNATLGFGGGNIVGDTTILGLADADATSGATLGTAGAGAVNIQVTYAQAQTYPYLKINSTSTSTQTFQIQSATAVGDTVVTGPDKFGKGSLTSVDTSTNKMTVSNVSSQFIPNTNGGSGTGTPEAFTAVDPTVPGRAPAPTTEPPAAADYSLIETDVDDAVQLTSWTNHTNWPVNSTVFVRVKYKDNTTLVSDFSEWSGFITQSTPEIGQPFDGGYFAGQINDGGTIYNLIVPARVQGSLEGNYGGNSPTGVLYKTTDSADSSTFEGLVYGAPITVAGAGDGTHPIFTWCINTATGPNAGNYDVTNAAGTGIGGKNDWYIPAQNELEICYRNLKPDTTANNTSSGANTNAVPSATSNYTSNVPAQTTADLFKEDAAQAYFGTDYDDYQSATQNPSSTSGNFVQSFRTGEQKTDMKTANELARAIRRVAA